MHVPFLNSFVQANPLQQVLDSSIQCQDTAYLHTLLCREYSDMSSLTNTGGNLRLPCNHYISQPAFSDINHFLLVPNEHDFCHEPPVKC